MEEDGIELPLVEVNGSIDAVNLLTVHGSKGLEFTYVFLQDVIPIIGRRRESRNRGFHFPDTMFMSKPMTMKN